MKPFSKSEKLSLLIIFTILIAVSVPNFIISVRKARDQVRRDDMGALEDSLGGYSADFGAFPLASSDGRILDCLKPGDKPVMDKIDKWTMDLIPCEWGNDPFANLIDAKIYIAKLPRDPDYLKGAKYLYFSDGEKYQIYASMEGADEAEVDTKIIARGLTCGTRICNMGRSANVPTDISIEEYDKVLLSK